MLSGTDLNYAFAFALDDVNNGGGMFSEYGGSKYSSIGTLDDGHSSMSSMSSVSTKRSAAVASPPSKPSQHKDPVVIKSKTHDLEDVPRAPQSSHKLAPPPQASNVPYDSIFSHPSPEQKIQFLSNELSRQRELLEQQRLSNVGYFDKLMARRKELLKFALFSLIILLALSIHYHVKHYYKTFFQSHVLTPPKEFGIRLIYPVVILFIVWNLRVFVR